MSFHLFFLCSNNMAISLGLCSCSEVHLLLFETYINNVKCDLCVVSITSQAMKRTSHVAVYILLSALRQCCFWTKQHKYLVFSDDTRQLLQKKAQSKHEAGLNTVKFNRRVKLLSSIIDRGEVPSHWCSHVHMLQETMNLTNKTCKIMNWGQKCKSKFLPLTCT